MYYHQLLDTIPVFYISKESWDEKYQKIINECLEHRDILMIEPDEARKKIEEAIVETNRQLQKVVDSLLLPSEQEDVDKIKYGTNKGLPIEFLCQIYALEVTKKAKLRKNVKKLFLTYKKKKSSCIFALSI